MGGLFSSSPAPAAPATAAPQAPQMSEHDKAVMQLKITRDRLQKYKKKAEKDSELYVVKAKELVKQGRKDRALVALRMKKYKDKQCQQVEGQLDNIMQMLGSVETAEMTRTAMKALEIGNQALKRLHEEMPIEKIEAIMEENAEAIAYQSEISDILSRNLDAEDDSEVDAELLSMQAEISGVPDLPVAPTTKVKKPAPAVPSEPQPQRERVLVPT